ERAVLGTIAMIALLSIGAATTLQSRAPAEPAPSRERPAPEAGPVPGLLGVTVVVAAFVLLQAANATATSFMTVYVTQSLALDVVWAGIALGTAAGLEIPSLFLMGRLSGRFSAQLLIVTGCALGVVYYLALFAVQTPVGLIGIQVLNAWSFAAIAGTGLTLFQEIIARPGLATSLYMNARRVGAILSGPVIALGSVTVFGQAGIFLVCALLPPLGTVGVALAHARARRSGPRPPGGGDHRHRRPSTTSASTTSPPPPSRVSPGRCPSTAASWCWWSTPPPAAPSPRSWKGSRACTRPTSSTASRCSGSPRTSSTRIPAPIRTPSSSAPRPTTPPSRCSRRSTSTALPPIRCGPGSASRRAGCWAGGSPGTSPSS